MTGQVPTEVSRPGSHSEEGRGAPKPQSKPKAKKQKVGLNNMLILQASAHLTDSLPFPSSDGSAAPCGAKKTMSVKIANDDRSFNAEKRITLALHFEHFLENAPPPFEVIP